MTVRIHLSLMQPAGYVHSQGFLDQARYARWQLRRLGAEVTIGKNRLREDAVNIVFGAHLGFSASFQRRYTCVLFNLEQLGEGGASVTPDYLDLLRTSPAIDYDDGNLAAYGRLPGDVPIVSFQWAPYLATTPPLPLHERPIDLLFFGSMNERRQALFSRIEACGWSVARFDHPLYGEERDPFIRQSKAVFNCHYYETSRFEQARAFHTLSLGTPVISERTARTSPPAAFEDVVTWVTDDTLEAFFREEFMTPAWQTQAQAQLQAFTGRDPQAQWQAVHGYCTALWRRVQGERAAQVWRPAHMTLGAGPDYRLGSFNVDSQERNQPDLVLDLGRALTLPLQAKTLGGGQVRLEAASLDQIHIGDVLAHGPDLSRLMTNLLTLLREDGEVELLTPRGQEPATGEEPARLGMIHQVSLQGLTSDFWRLGWFEHRFEFAGLQWLDSQRASCLQAQAAYMKVKLRKVRTTPHERSLARTLRPDFGGIPQDLPAPAKQRRPVNEAAGIANSRKK